MDWLLNLPIAWLAIAILAASYAVAGLIYFVVRRLAVGERIQSFKAISAGMLSPLAVVFALLVGFLAAQVWSDADRAGTAVNREASALRAAVLLSDQFPGDAQRRLRELIRQHITTAAADEWPAMARHGANLTLVPHALADALRVALSLEPRGAGQALAQRELVASIQSALDARRQRIVLSGSSVNVVKWGALLVQAALILLTIAMVHCDNPLGNRIILAVFATGAAAAVLLIAAHSRPFSGALSIRPALLLQVMPEGGEPSRGAGEP
ncbi:MAG TPA: hypothetical protein VMY76_16845 [Gemmatimonadales bacterium]|nr:hypothetical protein [Gemmatimonadales bacterium]